MKPRTDAGETGLRYLTTSAKIRRVVDERMAGGVSLARTKVLQVLAELGPVKQTRLAEELGMAPRSITQAVEAMERDGLVERYPDPADKRAKVVAATERGALALATGEQTGREVLKSIFERLSPDQLRALDEVLDVLNRA